jgi:hypothetical protein
MGLKEHKFRNMFAVCPNRLLSPHRIAAIGGHERNPPNVLKCNITASDNFEKPSLGLYTHNARSVVEAGCVWASVEIDLAVGPAKPRDA